MKSRDLATIDIGPLVGADPDGARATDRQLGEACRRVGFVRLVNHGLHNREMDGVLADARTFFALAEDRKLRMATRAYMPSNANRYRGYFPTSSGSAHKEAFEIGREDAAATVSDTASFMNEPNVWPARDWVGAGWRSRLTESFARIEHIGMQLLKSFARSLNSPEDALARHFVGGCSTLRMIHYPSHPACGGVVAGSAPVLGTPEHTDSGFVTLLIQDAVGGLQVRDMDGTWIDVEPVAGSIIMNLGDLLERWTGGVFRATPHRVLASGGSRYSVPFFLEPRAETVVACLDSCSGVGRPEPPIVYVDYLRRKLEGFQEYAGLISDN